MGQTIQQARHHGRISDRLRTTKRAALVGLAAIAIFQVSPDRALCSGPSAPSQLRASIENLDQWLGSGMNARRWRRFLRLNRLRQQLANADAADTAALQDALDRFDRSEEGLKMPRFQAVRAAISRWRNELVAESQVDIDARLVAARDQFKQVTPEDAASARAELLGVSKKLEEYLETGGQNGEAWKRFLLWDDLKRQLAEGANVDRSKLESTYHRLTSGHQGLELPVFLAVRQALRNYLEQLWAAGDKDQRDNYMTRVDILAQALRAVEQDAASDQRGRLGRVLGVLERRGQNRRLIGSIRRRYSKPNLLVQISGDFLNAGMAEPIDESQPLTDSILGASISGTGRTQGNVRIELIPSADGARFEAVFEGAVRTQTVGRKGPARFGTRGVTQIVGRHRLRFDGKGIASATTESDAQTNTTTTGIWSNRCGPIDRLVRRVASRRLSRDRSLGEQIASRHAEERFNESMNERIAKLVSDGNQTFWAKYRDPLEARGEFPRLFRFHTGGETLNLTVLQANALQLGAPDAPPPLEGNSDIAVRIHESMLNNLAEAMLSGATLDEETFLADIAELFGSVPEFLEPDEDAQPWIITFQRRLPPIVVKFNDGNVRITIRGRRFASADRDIRRDFDITAEYRLVKSETGLTAILTGDLEVFPTGFDPEKDTLSLRQQSPREILERKFKNVFKEEMSFDLLALPGPWEAAGELRPVQVLCDEGWLVLSWRLEPSVTQPVVQAESHDAESVAAVTR